MPRLISLLPHAMLLAICDLGLQKTAPGVFQAEIKFTCEDEGAIHHAACCVQDGVKELGMWDLEFAKASWSAKIDPNCEVAYVGEGMAVGIN